jgi:hypothetical protein
MKLRVIATLCLTLALAAGSASAQSIGFYFDANGGSLQHHRIGEHAGERLYDREPGAAQLRAASRAPSSASMAGRPVGSGRRRAILLPTSTSAIRSRVGPTSRSRPASPAAVGASCCSPSTPSRPRRPRTCTSGPAAHDAQQSELRVPAGDVVRCGLHEDLCQRRRRHHQRPGVHGRDDRPRAGRR